MGNTQADGDGVPGTAIVRSSLGRVDIEIVVIALGR